MKDRGDVENAKRIQYLNKKNDSLVSRKISISLKMQKLQDKLERLQGKLQAQQDRMKIVDKSIEKINKERDYINSIVRFDKLQDVLDSDIPFEKKITIRYNLKKHYDNIYEKIQDDFESLKTENYFEIEDMNEIKVLNYILDSIFDFMCLNDIQTSIQNLKNLNIDNGTFVNNLDTCSSIYYFNEKDYIKINVNVGYYNILKTFDNPLNLLFYRNTKMVDIYVKERGYSSKTFKLNYATYLLMKKKKSCEIEVDKKVYKSYCEYIKKYDSKKLKTLKQSLNFL